MVLQNSVHYRALEHARDAIRSVSVAGGGFRDLREVTWIEGEAHSNRGDNDVRITLDMDTIGLGAENPNLVTDTTLEFQVAIWVAVSGENPRAGVPPLQALDYIFRDVWKALMQDPQRGGLAFDTSFVNGQFGQGESENQSGHVAFLDWTCELEHDGEDIAVIHGPLGNGAGDDEQPGGDAE